MSRWAIAAPTHIERPSVYDGGKCITTWNADLRYGTFATNLEAKLALLVGLEILQPGKQYSPEFIRGHFRYFHNTQTAKVVRV